MCIEDWLLLKTLYETKTLTQTSQQLFVSQPALSKRLRRIERELGCQIALSSNKGIIFTVEGCYLAKQAERFIALDKEIKTRLTDFVTQNRNVLRIASPSSFAKYDLIDLIASYRFNHPEIRLEMSVDVSNHIPSLVQTHAVDCGFILGDVAHSLPKLHYATQQGYAVSKEKIFLEDLPEMPLILYNRSAVTQTLIVQWLHQHYSVFPTNCMYVTDLDTALDMVSKDLGYTIAFSGFLKKRPYFSLTPLYNKDGTPFQRNAWFVYSDSGTIGPHIGKFIDFITEWINRQAAHG